jgi:hypothetical protein
VSEAVDAFAALRCAAPAEVSDEAWGGRGVLIANHRVTTDLQRKAAVFGPDRKRPCPAGYRPWARSGLTLARSRR